MDIETLQKLYQKRLEEEIIKRQSGIRGLFRQLPSRITEKYYQVQLEDLRKQQEKIVADYQKKVNAANRRQEQRFQGFQRRINRDLSLLEKNGPDFNYCDQGPIIKEKSSASVELVGDKVRKVSRSATYSGCEVAGLYWKLWRLVGQKSAELAEDAGKNILQRMHERRRK